MTKKTMIPEKDGYICVGVVTHAHGIQGEVRVKAFTDVPEDMGAYGHPVDVAGTKYRIKRLRAAQKGVLVKFEGVNTRNEAEALKGVHLFVPKDKLPAPAEDETYWVDLEGREVRYEDGQVLGYIKGLFHNGAHDVVVVITADQKEVLLPYVDDVVCTVDDDSVVVFEFARQFEAF